MISEKEYRQILQSTYDQIEAGVGDTDPDLVECEQSLGAMMLRFADGSKCILSAQPSVRQLWIALAARGIAYHFNYNLEKKVWEDDKGKGIELKSMLQSYLKEMTGTDFSF